MLDWYLNLHPVQIPFATLILCVCIYVGNLYFWFFTFKVMKQIMLGMEVDTDAFFYGDKYRHGGRKMKEVFLTFMHVPGYSIFWFIQWMISKWLFHIGKALNPLNK